MAAVMATTNQQIVRNSSLKHSLKEKEAKAATSKSGGGAFNLKLNSPKATASSKLLMGENIAEFNPPSARFSAGGHGSQKPPKMTNMQVKHSIGPNVLPTNHRDLSPKKQMKNFSQVL